jgi:hypothetical protein
MSNLNLKQTCLLDVSGELPPEARKELLGQISNDPAAINQYETIRKDFALLSMLPIPEPSAEERRRIPATIKGAVNAAFAAPVNQARRFGLLTRYAAAAAVLVTAMSVCWATWTGHVSAGQRQAEQVSRIYAATERIVPTVQKPTAYNQAVTEVQASIRQLQTESPTLSQVYDQNLANLLDALASVP